MGQYKSRPAKTLQDAWRQSWQKNYALLRQRLSNPPLDSESFAPGLAPLHYAVFANRIDIAEQLPFPESAAATISPLHVAAMFGYVEMATFLIEKGLSVDTTDNHKFTPLHVAAHFNQAEMVAFLLERGADANAVSECGDTPIHLAAYNGNNDIVTTLLSTSRCNIDAVDKEGMTAVLYGCRCGHLALVDLLTNAPYDADIMASSMYGDTALHLAAYNGHLEICVRIISKCDNSIITMENIYSETPFHAACTHGKNLDVVRLLLNYIPDVNYQGADGHTAFHSACWHGHLPVVQMLIQEGSRFTILTNRQFNNTAECGLMWAYQRGNDEVVKAVLSDAIAKLNDCEMVDAEIESAVAMCAEVIPLPSPMGRLHQTIDDKHEIMKLRTKLPKEHQISLSEVNFFEKIGGGTFAQVYKAEYRGKVYAVKRYSQDSLRMRSKISLFTREVSLLQRLNHPNIVKFKGACLEEPSKFLIFCEYLAGGTLFSFLHVQRRKVDMGRKISILADVARGMTYLHTQENPIMHRDLNPHNILLDAEGRAVVSDFGEATLTIREDEGEMTKQPGNLRWMAPEVFVQDLDYCLKADVFSFGLVMWELITEEVPLEKLTPAAAAAEMAYVGVRPSKVNMSCPPHIVQLYMEAWDADPDRRPPFSEVLERLVSSEPVVGQPRNVSSQATPHTRKPMRAMRSQVLPTGYVADVLQTVRGGSGLYTASQSPSASPSFGMFASGALAQGPFASGELERGERGRPVTQAAAAPGRVGSPARTVSPEKGALLPQRQRLLLKAGSGSDPAITTLPAHAMVKTMLLQQAGRSSSATGIQAGGARPHTPPVQYASSLGNGVNSKKSIPEAVYSLV